MQLAVINKVRLASRTRTRQLLGAALMLFVVFYLSPSGVDVAKTDQETAVVVASGRTAVSSLITIVTGTHFNPATLALDERQQDGQCVALADAIHLMWSAWEVNPYSTSKERVRTLLTGLAHQNVRCVLSGSRKHSMLWTFPMSWRPDLPCDAKIAQVLASKSYLKEKTKVYVNWFLLRPDLVTLANMVSLVDGLEVRFAVSLGADVASAAFSQETRCPRIATILARREVYKQRLLLVSASDVQHQVGRLPGSHDTVAVTVQGRCEENDSTFVSWVGGGGNSCELGQVEPAPDTHLGTVWRLPLLSPNTAGVVPKTVFTGPRLVFVAGLEGVGHHVFAQLGRKHTTRNLYEALTDHLCDSAWDDDSAAKYGAARQRLVDAMRGIHSDDGVVFLNTVFAMRDVNMYSFPWGGPRCFLKRYARVLCNIDLVELVRMAESAGVDFRVVFLKRGIGAAVVSASLHRPFGTLVSETRMLALSWALLKSGVEAVDWRFVLEINYEDMINKPEEATAELGQFVGFDPSSALHAHFVATLRQSNLEHPVGDGSAWKEEVDMAQLRFMSDLLEL